MQILYCIEFVLCIILKLFKDLFVYMCKLLSVLQFFLQFVNNLFCTWLIFVYILLKEAFLKDENLYLI